MKDARKLLEPWRKALSHPHATTEDGVLWLRLDTYKRSKQVVGFSLEGVELLLWLARASVAEFSTLMTELWPDQLPPDGGYTDAQRLGLRVYMDVFTLLASHGRSAPFLEEVTISSGYGKAQAEFVRVLRNRDATGQAALRRPEILVHILGGSRRVFPRSLPLIADMMKVQSLSVVDSASTQGFNLRVTTARSLRWISVTSYKGVELYAIQSIALALFSSLARHGIDHVSFTIFTERPVQRLLDALSLTEDPLAFVYGDHAASIRAHQHLRASASRFTLFDPTATKRTRSNDVVETATHTGLRIINRVNDWWCVLLPAWDRAWVRDTDIQVTTLPAGAVSRVGNPTVRKIDICCYNAQVNHVEAIVRCMNPSVEELTLTAKDDATPVDAWASIASSFPCLRRLSLSSLRPRHLASLVDAIASLGPRRALVQLTLRVVCERDEFELMKHFVDVIADRSNPISQCLTSLFVDARVHSRVRAQWQLMRRVKAMLDSNTRLVSCGLHASASAANAASFGVLREKLMAHRGRVVSVCADPLARRHKLAFLSATYNSGAPREGSALKRMDSGVIAIIFEFAAHCCRRDVAVRVE